jgi:thiol-disulfide isomerase/thioredoxin
LTAALRQLAPIVVIAAGFMLVSVGVRIFGSGELHTEMPELRGAPRMPSPFEVTDTAGRKLTIADFHGRYVLLNFWATWCTPCRTEMPSLNILAARLPTQEMTIVPVSVDVEGATAVTRYYAALKLDRLPVYLDARMAAMQALGIIGIPTTLIIDRDGREIGRLIGPAQWDAPAIVKGLIGLAEKAPSR